MAKQAGDIKLTGCIHNLQFYKMDGKYYVRKKSSLTGRRVKTDKAFTLTMAYSDLLKTASPIASKVYLQMPKKERDNKYRLKLVGLAMQMIRQGITVEEIYTQLYDRTFPPSKTPERVTEPVALSNISFRAAFAEAILNSIFLKKEQEEPCCFVLEKLPP
jgi:hypothetical protein